MMMMLLTNCVSLSMVCDMCHLESNCIRFFHWRIHRYEDKRAVIPHANMQ